MEMVLRKEKAAQIVSIKGRMDAVTAPELEKQLLNLISEGEHTLVLDLADLEYISSAGLRVILASAKKLKEKNGSILIAGAKGTVAEVLKISGFHSIFKIFDSKENALREI